MQKFLWIVFIAGGLWYAKTQYYDEPKPKTRTQLEAAAESLGRYKAAKRGIEVPERPDAPPVDQASAASMLESLQAMVGANKTPAEKAQTRFEQFMKSWHSGGVSESDEAQAAMCLWARGTRALPLNELSDAATFFDLWRKEKGLYVESFRYDIKYFTPKDDHLVAVVNIDGTTYQMGVPYAANPIFWVK
jgi:hypothetical protein